MIPKFLIVYRTSKNEIKDCLVSSVLFRHIGDVNNRGWVILDIQVFYKGSFIKLEHYKEILKKSRNRENKKRKIKAIFRREPKVIIIEKNNYFYK